MLLVILAPLLLQDAGALVEQLRSEDVAARERAMEELKKLGAKAAPELEKATADADAEVAQRARLLLRMIDVRAQLPAAWNKLAGTRLQDDLRGSVAETVQEVARQAGLRVDASKAGSGWIGHAMRRHRIAAREVDTFWRAWWREARNR